MKEGIQWSHWDKIQLLCTRGGQPTFLVWTDHVFLNWRDRHQEKGRGFIAQYPWATNFHFQNSSICPVKGNFSRIPTTGRIPVLLFSVYFVPLFQCFLDIIGNWRRLYQWPSTDTILNLKPWGHLFHILFYVQFKTRHSIGFYSSSQPRPTLLSLPHPPGTFCTVCSHFWLSQLSVLLAFLSRGQRCS